MATGIVPDPPDLVASCPVWTRRRFFQAMLAAGLGAFIPAIGGGSSTPPLRAIPAAPPTVPRPRAAPPPLESPPGVPRGAHSHTPPSPDSTRTGAEKPHAAPSPPHT